ncbi:hypothetical protein BKA70DRAFT_1396012 [Coprinopsis sp. MPI-PUGE-AT-0042]|nr:hypothetical protein BKA70DRAFT_1396012 [Coprinopsis sp. MPI-PUGE-AT-0042]
MQMGSKWTAEGELTFGERDATISTARRDEDPDEYLPISQNQLGVPGEDTALLLERHEKLGKWFMSNIEAPMQEERRRIEDLVYKSRAQPKAQRYKHHRQLSQLDDDRSVDAGLVSGEWEWLREESPDSSVVCPQDAAGAMEVKPSSTCTQGQMSWQHFAHVLNLPTSPSPVTLEVNVVAGVSNAYRWWTLGHHSLEALEGRQMMKASLVVEMVADEEHQDSSW